MSQASVDRLASQMELLRAQMAKLQEESRFVATTAGDLSSAWLITCGAMVFFMQTGFAMLETGVVAKRNVVNVLFKNVVDACIAGVLFWLVGYGVAYGDTWRGFIGSTNFALASLHGASLDMTTEVISLGGYARWFFRWTFAGAAATIVSGSVCERVKIPTYMCFSAIMSSFIYPVVVHWLWGKGFLSDAANRTPDASEFRAFWTGKNGNGVLDLGGSGAVHMVGGLSGLMGAIIIGPRLGRFDPVTGLPRDMPEHNVTLMILGTGVLWFGWYGFNCGSVHSIILHSEAAARAAVNTTISASTGCLVVTFVSVATNRYFDVTRMVNGILAALVSITASADIVQPWMAFIIGGVGSLVYYGASLMLIRLRIDDPLDASAVHAFGGMWGLLAAGIFCVDSTVQANKSPGPFGTIQLNDSCTTGLQFGMQVLGIVCITVWVVTMSSLAWLGLKYTIGVRVSPHVEEAGMDAMIHGMSGYNDRDHDMGWVLETAGTSVQDEIRKRGYDYSEHPDFRQGSPSRYDPYARKLTFDPYAKKERMEVEHGGFQRAPSLGVGPPSSYQAGDTKVPVRMHAQGLVLEHGAPPHHGQQPMLLVSQPRQVMPYHNGSQMGVSAPPQLQFQQQQQQQQQQRGPPLGQPKASPQPFMIHMSPQQQNLKFLQSGQQQGQGQQGGYMVQSFKAPPPQQQQWAMQS